MKQQAAEYLTQWEAFISAKHARSFRGKKLSKAAWKLCCQKFSDAVENSWMAAVEQLQLAELDNFHNEIRVSFPLTFWFWIILFIYLFCS